MAASTGRSQGSAAGTMISAGRAGRTNSAKSSLTTAVTSAPRASVSRTLLIDFSTRPGWVMTATTQSGLNQGQRAMLQLAGRVGFGVQVRYLLEFELALETDRIVEAAADEECVTDGGHGRGINRSRRVQRAGRQGRESGDLPGSPFGRRWVETAPQPGQLQRQEGQDDHRGGVGLVEATAISFGAGPRIDTSSTSRATDEPTTLTTLK